MSRRRTMTRMAPAAAAGLSLFAAPAWADFDRPNLNFYGVTGLIDMPTALNQPDGEIGVGISHVAGITRSTLSFQILPRVQGAFRYAGIADLNYQGFDTYYDRSFDISLQVLGESLYLPAIKVGVQDFVGTGLYSGEYVVATKTFGDRVAVSAGLGWGRLSGGDTIGSPFGERPRGRVDQGGELNVDQWFRGPAALFGGITFQATDRLKLMAEYSSDRYALEQGRGRFPSDAVIDIEERVNLGAAYRLSDAATLGAYYLYGSEVGVNLTFALNPYRPPIRGSIAPAPGPVEQRPARASNPQVYTEAWAEVPSADETLLGLVRDQLAPEGFVVESLDAGPRSVEVRVRNTRYDARAQAVGRVARALTRTMPPSVEVFRIVPVVDGMAVSAVTVRRSDLEAYVDAPDGTRRLRDAVRITDAPAAGVGGAFDEDAFPRLAYGLGPYIRRSYFDPEEPIRFGVGLRFSASYEPVPGLVLSGSVAKRLFGTIGDNDRESDSALPNVRTSFPLYDEEDGVVLERLTAAYYFKPAESVYGRVTGGYLERMFGGVSGELLWKPAQSRLALGAELNYARQRAYDQRFGFLDGEDAYDTVTGFVSAYYDLPGGFLAQVDVGRYLAGDVGATLGLDREFRNGWSVGAFATVTDVSAEEFGEGSFDKGIRVRVPLSWFTGRPSTRGLGTTIRPVTRDGGARLEVPGRLYDRVRDYHEPALDDQWGRVFR